MFAAKGHTAIAGLTMLVGLAIPTVGHAKHKHKGSSSTSSSSSPSEPSSSDIKLASKETDAPTDSSVSLSKTKSKSSEKGTRPISATAEVGYVYFGAGYGAGAAYQLTKKFEINADFLMANGEATASGDGAFQEYMNVSVMEFDFLGRYYAWNSLNVSGGLGYAMLSGDYGVVVGQTGQKLTAPYSASVILAIAGVGNNWKLKNGFVLGVDWISVVYPINTSVTVDKPAAPSAGASTSGAGANFDPYNGKSPEELASTAIGKQMQFRAAVVHAGYSF